jgi:hypothetical protein
MLSFLRGEPDVIIRWGGLLLLGGMALALVSACFKIPGIISAMHFMALGAAAGTLVQWRTDRGLWMVAGLFLAIFSAIYGMFLFGQFRDMVAGVQVGVGLAIDGGVATALLITMLRFLWRVTRYNWQLSRRPVED